MKIVGVPETSRDGHLCAVSSGGGDSVCLPAGGRIRS